MKKNEADINTDIQENLVKGIVFKAPKGIFSLSLEDAKAEEQGNEEQTKTPPVSSSIHQIPIKVTTTTTATTTATTGHDPPTPDPNKNPKKPKLNPQNQKKTELFQSNLAAPAAPAAALADAPTDAPVNAPADAPADAPTADANADANAESDGPRFVVQMSLGDAAQEVIKEALKGKQVRRAN